MKNNIELDALGIKPITSAIDTIVKKSFKGIKMFLSLTCEPALGELGLMAQDKIRY